jgi:regulator of nucleoside diphosphate kinase
MPESQLSPPAGSGAAQQSRIQVTEVDYHRLRSLIETWSQTRDVEAAEALAEELDRADVVPAERIAGNVVTMNSRVVFEDERTSERREISLVYPHESDVERGRISVLAPIGSALIGLAVGQAIDWPLPGNQAKRLRIVEVVYQPEQAGDFHL